MKKETFEKIINFIKESRKKEAKFLEGLDAVSPHTHNETFIYSEYENLLVDLLEEEFNDTSEVISWWIYDTEFGTDEKFRSIFVNNTEVSLDTAEKLYNYLTEHKN